MRAERAATSRRDGDRRPAGGARRGFSTPELLVALAVLGAALAIGTPALVEARHTASLAAAARDVAASLEAARWDAVSRGRNAGLYFEPRGDSWVWWRVVDGNGNGLRTREVLDGIDPRRGEVQGWRPRGNGARIALPSTRVREIPPRTGWMAPPSDPIRFGAADLVSFAPDGSSSSGTVFLRSGDRTAAVVLFGVTGRVRIWRWDERRGEWR